MEYDGEKLISESMCNQCKLTGSNYCLCLLLMQASRLQSTNWYHVKLTVSKRALSMCDKQQNIADEQMSKIQGFQNVPESEVEAT